MRTRPGLKETAPRIAVPGSAQARQAGLAGGPREERRTHELARFEILWA